MRRCCGITIALTKVRGGVSALYNTTDYGYGGRGMIIQK